MRRKSSPRIEGRRRLVPSRFVHRVSGRDWQALYHSLTFEVVFAPANLIDLALSCPSVPENSPSSDAAANAFLRKCEELGVLLPSGQAKQIDDEKLKDVIDSTLPGPRLVILYLALTDSCNLNCTYCMVEPHSEERRKKNFMSRETCEQAIDLLCRHYAAGDPAKTVIFYGGEPLLNQEVLRYAVESLRCAQEKGKLPPDLELSMVTNGTLLNPDLASFLKANAVQVGVSIDGPQRLHDICRRTASGKGSYDQAMRGVSTLREAGCEPGFSVTISNHNVEEMLPIAKWIVGEVGAKHFGFNMLLDNSKEHPSADYAERFNDGLQQCFDYCRQSGAIENRIIRKVRSFVDKRVRADDCGAIGYQLVVSPDGKAGVCQGFLDDRTTYLPIQDVPNIRDHPDAREFSKRSPLLMKECQNCVALGICGGGCPCRSLYAANSIWALDEIFCAHSQSSLQWLLDCTYREGVAPVPTPFR